MPRRASPTVSRRSCRTLGVMSRTALHLVYAVLWLGGLALAAVLLVQAANTDFGHVRFYSQIGSIVWVLGFALIFYSWARRDAPAHGRSVKSAAVFAALWPLLNVIAHVVYLFFTRGFRNGTLATLKFACFLLAAAIGWFLLGRALGAVL